MVHKNSFKIKNTQKKTEKETVNEAILFNMKMLVACKKLTIAP